jgi:hypothetical protein
LGKIFTERKEGGSCRCFGSLTTAIFLERDEKKRKKKARTNRFRRQDANLVDALPCPKGANKGSTFRVYVPSFSLRSGRVPECMTLCTRYIYRISFIRTLSVKKVF